MRLLIQHTRRTGHQSSLPPSQLSPKHRSHLPQNISKDNRPVTDSTRQKITPNPTNSTLQPYEMPSPAGKEYNRARCRIFTPGWSLREHRLIPVGLRRPHQAPATHLPLHLHPHPLMWRAPGRGAASSRPTPASSHGARSPDHFIYSFSTISKSLCPQNHCG